MSISVYCQGGMANQIFCYAAGLAAAKKLGTSLKINTSSFTGDPMREYSLHLWAGVTEEVDPNPPQEPIVREEGLPYNSKTAAQFKDGCTLWGYWQHTKYFEGVETELARRLVPKQEMTKRGFEMQGRILAAGSNSVFLTVRRTDYTKSDYHGVLGADYYERALNVVTSKIPNPEIFVFSDEPEWCRENIRFPYKTTIAGNFDRTVKGHIGREDEELTLMKYCRHAICANSSYSFWGAWLGADNMGGIVVRPKQWFQNADADGSQICPPHWISL